MATKKKQQKKSIKPKSKVKKSIIKKAPAPKTKQKKVEEFPVFKTKIPENVIENIISEIAGEDGVKIYKILKGRENVNEFEIAEKLKAPINYIRNIMYKFEQNDLITSTRKKDRKKGWYIYFYTFNPKQVEDLVLRNKKKRIELYKNQLERENMYNFYICPNRCSRYTLENTMEHNFMCPECGSLMAPEDKEKTVSRIKNSIIELENELNKLEANA